MIFVINIFCPGYDELFIYSYHLLLPPILEILCQQLANFVPYFYADNHGTAHGTQAGGRES
jgi:hypothetical protein